MKILPEPLLLPLAEAQVLTRSKWLLKFLAWLMVWESYRFSPSSRLKQLSGHLSFPWLVTLKTEASSRPAVFNFFRQFSRRCDWKHLHLNRSQDCKDSISAKEISVRAVHRNHFYEDCNGNCL